MNPINSIKFLVSRGKDYSKIELTEIKSIVGGLDLIIEAGASDGVDTQKFIDLFPAVNIHAFEPVKEQYKFLIKKFSGRHNIKIYNAALSDIGGTQKLHVGKSNGYLGGMGSSSLLTPNLHKDWFPQVQFNEVDIVNTIKLSEFILENKIPIVDLLWLDVQGKELDILTEAEQQIIEKVKSIHLECSRVNLYENQSQFKHIKKFMGRINFVCRIDRVGAISGNAYYLNVGKFFK
jgi:FkbM family methyltransferase